MRQHPSGFRGPEGGREAGTRSCLDSHPHTIITPQDLSRKDLSLHHGHDSSMIMEGADGSSCPHACLGQFRLLYSRGYKQQNFTSHVLEAGSPRSTCRKVQCLGRAHLLAHRRCLSAASSHVHQGGRGLSDFFYEGTNPIFEDPSLKPHSPPKGSTSYCHPLEG